MSIQPRREPIRYTDFKVNLDPHPVKKDLVLDKNEDAVKRSIKNLMFTDRYERPFSPRLGAGLKQFLFENIDSFTADNITNRIKETIEFYEPRAILHSVQVDVRPDENGYNAKIVFSTINNPEPIEFSTILERVR